MRITKLAAVLLAALAVLVTGASAAQAANFTAAEYPAFISGEQTGPAGTGGGGGTGSTIFGFESSLMAECKSAGFAGLLSEATGSLSVSSGYNECTAFGSAGTIESNGCEFVLHPGSGSGDEFTGTFDITCPEGSKITVAAGNCEVQIGAQNGLGPVVYKNLTTAEPKRAIEAKFQMTGGSGFAYTKAKDGSGCSLSGTGNKTDGVIVGAAKITVGSTETFEAINLEIK
jgi:hypothetical protein